MIQAQIVTIGQELLRGDIDNSNAVYLAQELHRRGMDIVQIVTLPDNAQSAAAQLKQCLIERGVVVITGGLGGTADDVSRTIIGDVMGRELIVDKEGEEQLRKWYAGRGRRFEADDRVQAAYPRGGSLLENSVGLAYGFYVQDRERHIFSLPGVPAEMKAMFHHSVLSVMKAKGLLGFDRQFMTLNFSNISEYTLDRIVKGIVQNYSGICYGTRASDGIIRIYLESSDRGLDECASHIERDVRDNFLYRGDIKVEEVVGHMLLAQNQTLSVAESCTGGLLAKELTDIPGSSRYFLGGVVAYSNEVKRRFLSVRDETLDKYGAVSEKTAREMAEGVMKAFSSSCALSVTGIAGPEGGTADKPVGTVYIGVAGKNGCLHVERGQYTGDRDTIRKRSVIRALVLALEHLRDQKGNSL